MKIEDVRVLHDIEITSEVERFKRYYQVGSEMLYPGHKLFSYDLRTGEVEQVRYDVELLFDTKTKKPIKKGRMNVDFSKMYKGALNESNARKQFKKMLNEVRETARYIRQNPLLDIRAYKHWDILEMLGFDSFKTETIHAAALIEKLKFNVIKEEKEKEDFDLKKMSEDISICHIIPFYVGKQEEVRYNVSMIGRNFVLFPNDASEYDLGYLLQTAFIAYVEMLVKGKKKNFDVRYVNTFVKKYEWLVTATEESLQEFAKLVRENTNVNKTK